MGFLLVIFLNDRNSNKKIMIFFFYGFSREKIINKEISIEEMC